MTDHQELLKSLDAYIEYAEKCAHFADSAFYTKCKATIEAQAGEVERWKQAAIEADKAHEQAEVQSQEKSAVLMERIADLEKQVLKTVWILTREINEYDQDGQYFEAVFLQKPTTRELMDLLHLTEQGANHILSGGGRIGVEHTWYFLQETPLSPSDPQTVGGKEG